MLEPGWLIVPVGVNERRVLVPTGLLTGSEVSADLRQLSAKDPELVAGQTSRNTTAWLLMSTRTSMRFSAPYELTGPCVILAPFFTQYLANTAH